MIKAKIDKKACLIDYFDEHWYKIVENDKVIATLPSVTSVLDKALSKGYGFNQFLMNNGNEAKVIAREAADSGSKLHAAIEKLINGEVLTAEYGDFNKKEWVKLFNFVNWYKNLKIESVATETTVYDIPLGVAGTADFVGKINGEIWLLDWKTGNNIYDSAHVQVAAYANFWDKLNDPKIQRAGIVHVGGCTKTKKDLNNVGIKLYEVDIARDYKTFVNTLEIYKRFYPDDKAPTSVYPLELQL